MTRMLADPTLDDPPAAFVPHRPDAAKSRLKVGGVTVILPCYNEQDVVEDTMRQIRQTLQATGRPFELLAVDDGSSDATLSRLQASAGEPQVKILRNDRNRGYGYSLKRAVNEARYELIVITDADGTYPNERIGELIELMGEADMVVGARTGRDVNVPLVRRPAKWALRRLAGYLAETDIPDLNSGLRVMKRSLVRKFIRLLPDGFSFTTTITLALLTHGHPVCYVPIDYRKRIGASSIRPVRDTLNFIGLIVRTVMYFRPLKIFAPISAFMLMVAVILAAVTKLAFGQLADVSVLVIAMASLQMLGIGLLADLIDKRSAAF